MLEDGVVISTGVNLRAAGGMIQVGAGKVLSVVAANHRLEPGVARLTPWNETRCGVTIGANVWVSAQCVVLPGPRIGDNTVIAGGSVVRGEVPAGELWATYRPVTSRRSSEAGWIPSVMGGGVP